MNITIIPGAATEDATQIDRIVAEMSDDMETLDGAIKKNIPSGVETNWSDEVRTNWEKYYANDVPETMKAMKDSAVNLRNAVDAALKYSA